MDKFTEQDRRRAATHGLAISALEGFEPDAEYLALLERFVVGELSLDGLHRCLDEATVPVSSAA